MRLRDVPEAMWLQRSNADIRAGALFCLHVGFTHHALLHWVAELLVRYQETSHSLCLIHYFPALA